MGTGSGVKFGIYASASGNGNTLAAVLDGKVGIGTNTVSSNEILEVNGRMRLRRTSFASGLWFNNISNGSATSDGAFVGMNNEISGSESVGFWLNNSFKLSVDRSGNTNIEGEFNRTQTGTSNIVPIAYGNINADGSINSNSSTGNFSVSKQSPGIYVITIVNESFNFLNYNTTATIIGYQTYGFISTNDSGSGSLAISIASTSGNQTDLPFCFVVYKK